MKGRRSLFQRKRPNVLFETLCVPYVLMWQSSLRRMGRPANGWFCRLILIELGMGLQPENLISTVGQRLWPAFFQACRGWLLPSTRCCSGRKRGRGRASRANQSTALIS